MRKLTGVSLLIGMLLSCSSEKPGDAIHSLMWLEGTWMNIEGEATASEVWSRISPLVYTGIGLTMNQQDTLFYENLKIVQEDGYVFYIANVGAGPVKFRLVKRTEGEWVFSNPEHDFPKKIVYSRQKSGKEEWLLASVEGNGRQIPFKFKRVR